MMHSVLLVLLGIFLFPSLAGQVVFREVKNSVDMQEAEHLAAEEGKMMFVDVYATWCAPCKQMDREVYPDPDLSSYMNAHFVSVRLDGESDFGRKYAGDLNLQGYPSMFVFGPTGELIRTLIGYSDAVELTGILKTARENYALVQELERKSEKGKLSGREYADYVRAVREMGNEEKAEALAQSYVEKRMAGRELTRDDIGVVAFYMDLNDRWWSDFSGDPDRLRKVLGEDYMLSMEKIYNNTLIEAINSQDAKLISRLANELAPLVKEEETSTWDLRTLPFLQFYYYTDRLEELISYVNGRFDSDKKGDHQWLYSAASQITDMDQQYMTPKLLEKEVDWFRQCFELEEQFDYYFYHGMVLYILKRFDEAWNSFVKAEELASR
ncbi:MAG: thioredoxin family protein [Bacteroidales bacterium]